MLSGEPELSSATVICKVTLTIPGSLVSSVKIRPVTLVASTESTGDLPFGVLTRWIVFMGAFDHVKVKAFPSESWKSAREKGTVGVVAGVEMVNVLTFPMDITRLIMAMQLLACILASCRSWL